MEMQRRHGLGILILLTIVIAIAYVANSANAGVGLADLENDQLEGDGSSMVESDRWPAASSLSCKNSAAETRCAELEQQILDSVVRLEIYYENIDSGSGLGKKLSHGTIKDGRYLVIHNHFQVSFSQSAGKSEDDALTFAMYKTSGEILMLHTGSLPFSMVVEEEETLVLDFGTRSNGQGYFEWLGMTSASFMGWQDVPLQPGDEVAQIDHDGKHSFITWTRVDEVITNDGVPRITMQNDLIGGASGGGVFWNGFHIANNWGIIEHTDEDGRVYLRTSVAALNSGLWPENL
jgi:hypothetical protein